MLVMIPSSLHERLGAPSPAAYEALLERVLDAYLKAGAPRQDLPAPGDDPHRLDLVIPIHQVAAVHALAESRKVDDARIVLAALAFSRPHNGGHPPAR